MVEMNCPIFFLQMLELGIHEEKLRNMFVYMILFLDIIIHNHNHLANMHSIKSLFNLFCKLNTKWSRSFQHI